MEHTILYIIIGITVFSYFFESFLLLLNSKHRSTKVPAELASIYEDQEYRKSVDYGKTYDKINFIRSTLSTLLILCVLYFGLFSFINGIAVSMSDNGIYVAIIFIGIIALASDLLNVPFSLYSIFVVEEKFGFNKMDFKTWILDKIKSLLLIGILGGLIFYAFIWFYLETRELFWLFAWLTLSVISILITMFYSSLIVPLFNKQVPLEEGELKESIRNRSKKAGFSIENIYVINGSKRSTKANAYFSGLGAKKRIVLYDTLINDLSVNEITAVLSHEIGHYKRKHTLSNISLSILQSGIMLYIFSLFIDNPLLSKALGSDEHYFQLGFLAFGLLYSPISLLISILFNILSRKFEYEADKFAKTIFSGEYLISALKKLNSKSLSNLCPHSAYIFVYYSHPSLLQRIKAIKDVRN